MLQRFIVAGLAAGLLATASLARAVETLTLGVFAYRPKPVMAVRYQPLADYLSTRVKDVRIELLILDQAEMETALGENRLDLVLTNPSHYLVLRSRNSLSGALATVISLEDGAATRSLGGVIIARAGRTDLTDLAALKGRTIAIPGTKFLGGYQTQAYELQQVGIELPGDAALKVVGSHDAVITAILDGQAEAGFIRTGVLERLTAEGRLVPGQLQVINPQKLTGFPYAVSTRLYPEWPFMALPHVDERVVRRIASALLELEADHPAARAAGIAGFAPPADYLPVENLARALRLPPFDAAPRLGWGDIWNQYAPWLASLAALLLALSAAVLWLLRLNRQVEQARLALSEAEGRYRLVVENTPSIIYSLDAEGRFRFVSPSWTSLLGHPLDQVIGQEYRRFILAEDLPVCEAALRVCLDRQVPQTAIEYRILHQDGSLRWHSSNITPAFDRLGGLIAVIGNAVDITARKQAENRLQIAASVFIHAGEGIVITDAFGAILDVNDAFVHITGYRREEVLGNNPSLLKSGRQGPEFYAAMWRTLLDTGHWSGEVWNRRKNGEVYPEMLDISAVRDASGQTSHYVAIFSDITTIKEQQRRLEHIAHYDALTNLPNRVLLADRLHQAMAQVLRRGKSLAVAYLDLDGFKAVNDNYGHEMGDQLLITVAGRMRQALREVDTIARLGGDEFVAVLIDLEDKGDCAPMLRRLLSAAAQPVHVSGVDLQVSASVGVTLYPQTEAADPDQLLRQADQAMYQAKLAGKNRYHIFNPELDRAVRGHYESLEGIRHALHAGEFTLHYQPKVNMRTGAVIGAEALIRWQHPERGLLPPGVFLPVIEDHPLSVELGEWVIDTALTQMEHWHAQGLDIPVSVNIGAHHIQQANFMARLHQILAAHPAVQPACLELEVLETSALEDIAQVSEIMLACQAVGVRFALDDFGTGYSSLTYLKRLPAGRLKIDQSFVRDMLDDPDDLAILEGVLGLATAFGRQVIAEGVETVEHGELLLLLGCEEAQGYGIARPMPAAGFSAWAAAWRPDPAWVGRQAVSRDDVPILFASVEHRAWIRAIEQCLKGERIGPPPLDPHQCRFGLWLDGDGARRHRHAPTYSSIHDLHHQVHELAEQLLALHAQGRTAEALARMTELNALRDGLIGHLASLIRQD